MLSFVVGALIGGAMLGIVWMLATTPAVFAYRSGNGSTHTARRNTRDAWMCAYVAGVVTYVGLLALGIITY